LRIDAIFRQPAVLRDGAQVRSTEQFDPEHKMIKITEPQDLRAARENPFPSDVGSGRVTPDE
jgi:hypothetical protein